MANIIFWKGLAYTSLECCNIQLGDTGILITATIVGCDEGKPFNIDYAIALNPAWEVISFTLQNCCIQPVYKHICHTDGDGNWFSNDGKLIGEGCDAIDISLTPFTNTLAVQKLHLEVGEQRSFRVLYVDVQEDAIYAKDQLYTRLTETRYRYEHPDGSFTAEIELDEHNLVSHYEGLFERVGC